MANPLLNPLNANIGSESKELFKSRSSINNNILNNTISNFNKKTTFDNNLNFSSKKLQEIGNNIINSNNYSQNLNPGFKGSVNPTNTSYSSQNNTNMSMIRSKGNLRSAMDSLDLIPENDEKDIDNIISNMNNIDLFKNNLKLGIKDRYKENEASQILDEVNLFTKTILGTNNWGDSYPKLCNNSREHVEKTTYFKPQKKEIEKEVGKSILNTKLPRARLSTKAIETQNLSKLQKSLYKKNLSADGEKLFNSTSLSFLKPSAFSKAFNQILSRKND